MPNTPSPQLYARVPVRWDCTARHGRLEDQRLNSIGVIQKGSVTDLWYATVYARESIPLVGGLGESGRGFPTQADARRAVEEFWNVTTEEPS